MGSLAHAFAGNYRSPEVVERLKEIEVIVGNRRNQTKSCFRGRSVSDHTRWILRRQLLIEALPICEICEKDLTEQIHHKIPKRKDGSDEIYNLLAICTLCHAYIHPEIKEFVLFRKEEGIKISPFYHPSFKENFLIEFKNGTTNPSAFGKRGKYEDG